MSLGKRLKELRREKGWSQDEFAYNASIDGRQVSRYENDKVVPSVQVIIKMAKCFDVSIDYLLVEEVRRRPLHVTDNGLIERLKDIQELTEEDQASLEHILDALVAKNRIKSLASDIG